MDLEIRVECLIPLETKEVTLLEIKVECQLEMEMETKMKCMQVQEDVEECLA